jgi:hypothetical protein
MKGLARLLVLVVATGVAAAALRTSSATSTSALDGFEGRQEKHEPIFFGAAR